MKLANQPFCIIALGANLPPSEGDVWGTLRSALSILHGEPDISIFACSKIWRTPAHPKGSGPDYLNAAACLTTRLTPDALLERLHRIEARFGRDRSTGRWSARVLDLDLIAYGNRVLPDPGTLRRWMDLPDRQQRAETPDRLVLPHPRMQDRGFVLAPLAEIVPSWRHPLTGLTVMQMLRKLGPAGLAGMAPAGYGETRGKSAADRQKGRAFLDNSANGDH